MAARARFDRKYYDRFYGDSRARAAYHREEQRLGDFVCSYLKYFGQPVRRVVDIGCGLGQWQDIVRKHFPRASYLGVEQSEYLCAELGWAPGSAVDFAARTPFDLVICKDTLQYLSPKSFEAAAANLAKLCRGALYASVLTTEDWRAVCDRKRTDERVYLRSGNWYRRVFARHFVNAGGGVFLSEESPALPWELEKLTVRAVTSA
jgi:SAM-dependent methyltransferase